MKNVRYQRISIFCQAIIAICLLIIVSNEYGKPLVAKILYTDSYIKFSGDCNNAMHNEVALREKSDEYMVKSGEIELMVCHEYDLMRKKMLLMGITEEYLAYLNLKALETEKIPVSLMVQPHRMDHF